MGNSLIPPFPDIYYPLQLDTVTTQTTIGYYTGQTYNVNGGTLSTAGIISTADFQVGNSSLVLNNPNQNIKINSFTNTENGLSIACWFRSNGNSQYSRIYDLGISSSNNCIVLCIDPTQTLNITYMATNYTFYYTIVDPTIINNNIWYHVIWTMSNTIPSTWNIYINGVLSTSATQLMSGGTSKNLPYPDIVERPSNYLGKSNNTGDACFYGAIDDFRIFNFVLSQSQVTAIYTYPSAIITSTKYTINNVDITGTFKRKYLYTPGSISNYIGSSTFASGISTNGNIVNTIKLNNPNDLKFYNNSMYITDTNNNIILKVNALGVITIIAGTGAVGATALTGQNANTVNLNTPTAMVIDTIGNLYFVDSGNRRVCKINISTNAITLVAGSGSTAYMSTTNPLTANINPNSIVVDNANLLYISDITNHYIFRISATNVLSTYYNASTFSYCGKMAMDLANNIYYADSNIKSICKISNTGVYSLILSTNPVVPTHVCYDTVTQTIYYTSSVGGIYLINVQAVTIQSVFIRSLPTTQPPTFLYLDPNKNIYIGASNNIFKLTNGNANTNMTILVQSRVLCDLGCILAPDTNCQTYTIANFNAYSSGIHNYFGCPFP